MELSRGRDASQNWLVLSAAAGAEGLEVFGPDNSCERVSVRLEPERRLDSHAPSWT